MKTTAHYHTVFLSDVHLGTPDSKALEATDFLDQITCDKLVLNGDIVDGWYLRKGGKWRDEHTGFIRKVLEKMDREDMEVIYIRGNHDDILERFLPLAFANLSIQERYVHATPRGEYLVVHGDGFDSMATRSQLISIVGSVGYEILLRANRIYNKWLRARGRSYFSLSSWLKSRLKQQTDIGERYERQLENLARSQSCRGIICGHIHTPTDKDLNGIHYLNSGDWVESLTAIVEHRPGDFEVVNYRDFKNTMRSLRDLPDGPEPDEDPLNSEPTFAGSC